MAIHNERRRRRGQPPVTQRHRSTRRSPPGRSPSAPPPARRVAPVDRDHQRTPLELMTGFFDDTFHAHQYWSHAMRWIITRFSQPPPLRTRSERRHRRDPARAAHRLRGDQPLMSGHCTGSARSCRTARMPRPWQSPRIAPTTPAAATRRHSPPRYANATPTTVPPMCSPLFSRPTHTVIVSSTAPAKPAATPRPWPSLRCAHRHRPRQPLALRLPPSGAPPGAGHVLPLALSFCEFQASASARAGHR